MSLDDPQLASARSAWFTQLILFVGLVTSTAIYGVVLFVVTQRGGTPPAELPAPLLPALALAAFGAGAAAWLLRARMTPPLGDVIPGARDEQKPLDDDERAAVARLATALIVAWSLCEAIAIFGLVLGFLTQKLDWFWPFWGASLVSFALHRPDRARLDSVLAGAKLPR